MPGGAKPNRGIGKHARPLLKVDIENANAQTQSCAQAARYLGVTFPTYKKYAMLYGLYDTQKNQYRWSTIPRVRRKGIWGLDEILAGKHPYYDRYKLKTRLIKAGVLKECCAMCGYSQRRIIDGKVPLILISKDGNNHNLKLDNLEFRCFNCIYLTTGKFSIKYLADKDAPVNNSEYFADVKTIHQELSPEEIEQLQHEALEKENEF